MPRRNLETGSDSGIRDVRDRLSVSLGSAVDTGARDGHGPGLLELSGPPPACLPSVPCEGCNGALASGVPALGLPGHRGEAPLPLSARFRGRTGLRAAVLVGVLAGVLAGSFWWQTVTGTPEGAPLNGISPSAGSPPSADGGDPAATGATPQDAGEGTIIVHVSGAVASPGVLQLPRGSRLHEALARAGGSTAAGEQDRLNLASVLEDGQKILVPAHGEPGLPEQPGGISGGSGPAGGRKVDLNTAGVEELGTLPRVGPVLAQRIVDWRRQHGRFKAVEELDAVDGFGPKLLEALLPLVRV